jgi:hypothetical protein
MQRSMMKRNLVKLTIVALSMCVSNTTIAKSNIAKEAVAKRVVVTKTTKHKVTDKQGHKLVDAVIKDRCRKDCVDSLKLSNAIKQAKEKYQVSDKLILSVMDTESKFRQRVVNRGGCGFGLMQVCLRVHMDKFDKLKSKDHLSVTSNVLVGTEILKNCLDKKKGNINKALACYNGGGDKMYVTKVRTALAGINATMNQSTKQREGV